MRKITIGYSTHILASDAVLRELVSLLVLATDEKGDPFEFDVKGADDPATLHMKEAADKAAREEMERQGKDWLAQYQRAEKAEKALRELIDDEDK